MIFAIYKREADTCGNEDRRLLGYCEFDSKEDAEKFFPLGFFAGYWVHEITLTSPKVIMYRERERIRRG